MKVLLLTLFLLSMAFGQELSPEERQDRTSEEGYWSEWSHWSTCSESCGAGVRQRTRTCDGGTLCDGDNVDEESCSDGDCSEECLELDTAMPHNDLKNGRGRIDDVTSWRQCDTYCMEESDCKFWTYQAKKDRCFLKTSDANRKKVKNGAISGSSGCSTETVHRMTACQNANEGFFEDVIKVGGRCYRLSETTGTFDEAQEMCNGVDGKMFEPKSKEVNDEVATATANVKEYQQYWLGITKEESDGTWTYKNGEPISFTNWDANTQTSGGNCAITTGDLIYPDFHGTWLEFSCTEFPFAALCEF